MKITADVDLCVGAGQCVLVAPGIFDQDANDGRVVVLEDVPADNRAEEVRRAASYCPSGAITVTD